MPCNCVNSADNFCYVCGEVLFARQRKAIIAIVRKAYDLYFGSKIGDQDKSWALHICCRKCATNLSQWLNGKRHAMPFAFPVAWREPSNDTTDCCFRMVPPLLQASKRKRSGQWCIRIYHLLSVHLHMVKEFLFLNLRKNLPSIQTMRTKRVDLGFFWATCVH